MSETRTPQASGTSTGQVIPWAVLRKDEDRHLPRLNLKCQNDLTGEQIHIRRKVDDDGVYWKAFIIGAAEDGDLTGYGETPVAAILSLTQSLANLGYCWPVPDDEGNYT